MNVKALMIGVVVLGLIVAAWWFYHQGQNKEQLVEAKQDNKELVAALEQVQELTETIRQQEQDHLTEVSNIDQQWQKELSDAKRRSDGFINDVMSGKLRLWDKHARCGSPDQHPPGKTPAGASVGDGETGAELSEEVERFLELEAERADKVVIQLSACQEILRSDRK